jgi:hypothetical protein
MILLVGMNGGILQMDQVVQLPLAYIYTWLRPLVVNQRLVNLQLSGR